MTAPQIDERPDTQTPSLSAAKFTTSDDVVSIRHSSTIQ